MKFTRSMFFPFDFFTHINLRLVIKIQKLCWGIIKVQKNCTEEKNFDYFGTTEDVSWKTIWRVEKNDRREKHQLRKQNQPWVSNYKIKIVFEEETTPATPHDLKVKKRISARWPKYD